MPDEHDAKTAELTGRPSFSAGRRFGVGLNVIVAITAAFAIVVMVNYMAARHFKRQHWGQRAAQALSPQTLGVLASLTNDVRVVILFDTDEPLYPAVSALLTEYRHASPRVRLEYIDYLRDPAAAQLLKSQYRLQHVADKDLVLFDSGGRVRTVHQRELSDYDYSGLIAGTTNEVKRTAFKGEMHFTAALLSVSEARQPRACYLVGHGEANAQDEQRDDGYTRFLALLREKNIAVEGLTLFGTNDVPTNCNVIIVAGATDALAAPELEKLEKYLSQGGRALLLLNSRAQNTGLERMLARWGVAVGNNLVFDPKHTTGGYDLIAGQYGNHPAVRGLLGTRGMQMLMPRTVEKLAQSSAAADAPKVEELVLTADTSVAVTDIRNGVPYANPRDRKGPLSVAAAVEKGGLQGVSGDRGAARLVVVGDFTLFGNQLIEALANRDFASLSINWLLDRTMLLGGVGPRPVNEFKLNLTEHQMRNLRLILLALMPGGALLIGILVWFRRRR